MEMKSHSVRKINITDCFVTSWWNHNKNRFLNGAKWFYGKFHGFIVALYNLWCRQYIVSVFFCSPSVRHRWNKWSHENDGNIEKKLLLHILLLNRPWKSVEMLYNSWFSYLIQIRQFTDDFYCHRFFLLLNFTR